MPADGSAFSEIALHQAARLAQRLGLPIAVVSYIDTSAAHDAVSRTLRSLVASLPPGLRVDVRVHEEGSDVHVRGYVAERILGEAGDDTLVVMASHGRSGLGATLIGSVTEQVVRLSPRPVMVIGPACPDAPIDGGAVVACLDGSPLAERTLPVAARWAAGTNAELWVVQVIPDDAPPADDERYLRGVAAGYSPARADVLHGSDAAEVLVEFGERGRAAVLVLATRGRSGWSRLTLGSVAMNVVRHATSPVLLVGVDGADELAAN